MSTDSFKRKLTAVMSADVAGYSRLMEEDEAQTVLTLTAYRRVIGGLIQQHRGRVVDSPGDNILAEFASIVDAVQCGVAVQNELKGRNLDLPENRRMQFRIGINLGDVIEEDGRIYGDGVNISARLESLADKGGICVSGSVFEQVEDKVHFAFEYLGERAVKNIRKPVRVYRLSLETKAAQPATAEIKLPEKPSIAVLPFINMSGDPDQEYFSDGITEEIITGLSKVPEIFVIARNSSFSYKGMPVKAQVVAKELGIGYLLEGSVRRSGNRVRITAQLIDALTGRHLWAERYDRELKEIFAVQDDITIEIMRALQVKLTEGEQACEWLKRGSNHPEAYEKGMKGMEYFRRFSPEGNAEARRMFEEASLLDPVSPGHYVMLGWTHLNDILNGWTDALDISMAEAVNLTTKALDLDDSQADAHSLLGFIYLLKRDFDRAVSEGERAVYLNPNGADVHVWLAMILTSAGRPDEAIGLIRKAMRLNPLPPNWYFLSLGDAYFVMERYDQAAKEYTKAVKSSPGFLWAYLGLTASHSLLGHEKEAADTAAEVISIDPRFSLEKYEKSLPHKEQTVKDRYTSALRRSGLK